MKRFLSILLALALALTLGIPALAAEHQAGDTYIRILGSSGARTVGVRTTYGVYRQTADGAVYRDDRYEFVYTDDGVSWVSAGAAESSLGSGTVGSGEDTATVQVHRFYLHTGFGITIARFQ